MGAELVHRDNNDKCVCDVCYRTKMLGFVERMTKIFEKIEKEEG